MSRTSLESISSFDQSKLHVIHIFRKISDVMSSYDARAQNPADATWPITRNQWAAIDEFNQTNSLLEEFALNANPSFRFINYRDIFNDHKLQIQIFKDLGAEDADSDELEKKILKFCKYSQTFTREPLRLRDSHIKQINIPLAEKIERKFGAELM